MTDEALTVKLKSPDECRAEVDKVFKKHISVMNRIADIFAAEGLTPQEAEIICLWLAGTSHGMRGEPVTNDLAMFTLGYAWQFAASKVAN